MTENTCIAALLRDDREIITTKCDVAYLLNPDFGEMAIYLDDGHVLVVSSETDGQLIFGNRPPRQKKLEHFAKIKIMVATVPSRREARGFRTVFETVKGE